MAERRVLNVMAGTVAMILAGQFVYSPVFADNPANIEIIEVVDDGAGGYKPWEDIVGAMPGETYSAIPRVKNSGSMPVMVRMCLSESATDGAGGSIMLPANTFGIQINKNWALDNEGVTDTTDPASGNCYKYNEKLGVGAMTEPIFSEVTLSPALGNQYKNATFGLHLDAFAASEEPDEPVNPDNPDTGKATNTEPLNKVNTILYTLGAAALAVLIIHLIWSLCHREKK